MPNGLIDGSGQSQTLEASFETTSGGVILGYQAASPGNYPSDGWVPALYVGTDGKLYGGSYDIDTGSIDQVISKRPSMTVCGTTSPSSSTGLPQTMTLYLDGRLLGSVSGRHDTIAGQL